MVSCGSYRVIGVWEVPSGYHGWVLVERANPKCPPAVLTFTSVVLKVDSSGRGCTSTALPKGPQLLRFRGVDAEGARHALLLGCPGVGGQIWGYAPGERSNEFISIRQAVEFFVGTEAEFRVARRHVPSGGWNLIVLTQSQNDGAISFRRPGSRAWSRHCSLCQRRLTSQDEAS